MKFFKKPLFAAVVALLLGTSCCWISVAVFWLGGIALSGFIANLIGDAQLVFFGLGIILIIIAVKNYLNQRRRKRIDHRNTPTS